MHAIVDVMAFILHILITITPHFGKGLYANLVKNVAESLLNDYKCTCKRR